MAITKQSSDQLTRAEKQPISRLHSNEHRGRKRILKFTFTQDGAGDAGSIARLTKLPSGRTRVLSRESWVSCSAFGSGRTLNVGHTEYKNRLGETVAENADAIADGLSVVAAADLRMGDSTTAGVAAMDLEFDANDTPEIIAKVVGGTIPDGAKLEGWITCVQD